MYLYGVRFILLCVVVIIAMFAIEYNVMRSCSGTGFILNFIMLILFFVYLLFIFVIIEFMVVCKLLMFCLFLWGGLYIWYSIICSVIFGCSSSMRLNVVIFWLIFLNLLKLLRLSNILCFVILVMSFFWWFLYICVFKIFCKCDVFMLVG